MESAINRLRRHRLAHSREAKAKNGAFELSTGVREVEFASRVRALKLSTRARDRRGQLATGAGERAIELAAGARKRRVVAREG